MGTWNDKNNLTTELLTKLSLNEWQIDALLFFKEKGEITTYEYAKRYKVTDRSARYDLTELIEKNLIIKVGDRKATKYFFR